LEINGKNIGNDGTVPGIDDRINFEYLIQQQQIGDAVDLKIMRGGEERNIRYVLQDSLDEIFIIHYPRALVENKYTVLGGVVIQELSESYIYDAYEGGSFYWLREKDRDFQKIKTHGIQRALVITSVLPHEINSGYESFTDYMVGRVNGEDVHNVDQFNAKIAKLMNDDQVAFIRLGIKPSGMSLVFEKAKLIAADTVLREDYRY